MSSTCINNVRANHLTFEVYMSGPGDSRKLALCLHGFPEHAHSWRYQMPCLASLGYRVWAPNLRGYGNSSRPGRVADYAIEKLMDDVVGLIEAAGAEEVVLVGHDWGAVIAWMTAMRHPDAIDKLVILNVPHPAVFQRVLRSNFEQLRKSWYIFFFQLPQLPEWFLTRGHASALRDMFVSGAAHPENFTDADIQVFIDNVSQRGAARAMINYYRAMLRGGQRRQTRLGFPQIAAPTLMVWGENDMALDKATTIGTEQYVEDFTIRYLPGISHWVQQDAPDVVNAMLTAWLQGDPVPEMAELLD